MMQQIVGHRLGSGSGSAVPVLGFFGISCPPSPLTISLRVGLWLWVPSRVS